MNTVIFQIGLLAFCVAVVIFGVQQLPLMEVVSRSFMVFVGVVVICAILYTINVMMLERSKSQKPMAPSAPPPTPMANAGKKAQSS